MPFDDNRPTFDAVNAGVTGQKEWIAANQRIDIRSYFNCKVATLKVLEIGRKGIFHIARLQQQNSRLTALDRIQ